MQIDATPAAAKLVNAMSLYAVNDKRTTTTHDHATISSDECHVVVACRRCVSLLAWRPSRVVMLLYHDHDDVPTLFS